MIDGPVKILALEYQIAWLGHGFMELSGAHGICDTHALTITIDQDAPEQRQKVTLLHEIIHALNDQLQMQEQGSDEDISTRLSVGLMTVSKTNPEVWQWIFA